MLGKLVGVDQAVECQRRHVVLRGERRVDERRGVARQAGARADLLGDALGGFKDSVKVVLVDELCTAER